MTILDQQKAEYLSQINAFFHANIDGKIALMEVKRKSDGKDVIIVAIVQQTTEPSLIVGGEPTAVEQLIPVFEMVDPQGENPYISNLPGVKEIEPESVIKVATEIPQ